ncbi:alkaline phosphatase D family protein [Sedimenticola sp.]|uniref:alkaline phosphatase D family protein n=1 Tax=Sedimenticola sp. TaxID=1940285 RepID=UPI003D10B7F4
MMVLCATDIRVAYAGSPVERIAFGSCLHQDRPQPVWQAVQAFNPDVFIFAGDNVYGDILAESTDPLKQAYQRAGTNLVDLKLGKVLATWDDHDYGADDAGGDFRFRAASKELFLNFWKAPADDPRRSREGIYSASFYGAAPERVQIILLDTRSFRSRLVLGNPVAAGYESSSEHGKTMLGEAQWAWLENQLDQPADLRLIVSSIQVLATAHGGERWDVFPHERSRLLNMIAGRNRGTVLLISGDRHFGAFYSVRLKGEEILEITSSGLNLSAEQRENPVPQQLGDPLEAVNFGTLSIDWNLRTAIVALHDGTGLVVQQQILSLGQ